MRALVYLFVSVVVSGCGQSHPLAADAETSEVDAGGGIDGSGGWTLVSSAMFVGEDLTEPYAVRDSVGVRLMFSGSRAPSLCERLRASSLDDADRVAIAVIALRAPGEPIEGVYEYPSVGTRSAPALWAPFGPDGELRPSEGGSVVRASVQLTTPGPGMLQAEVRLDLDSGPVYVSYGEVPVCYGLGSGPLFRAADP